MHDINNKPTKGNKEGSFLLLVSKFRISLGKWMKGSLPIETLTDCYSFILSV